MKLDPVADLFARSTKRSNAKRCLRRESNPDLEFRKSSFYPLNYGGAPPINRLTEPDVSIATRSAIQALFAIIRS